jgi:DNA polymerase-3 subunit gamma/tau
MSEFVVSALKYRPKKFSDVVGQEAVTKTLENAIATNKIPNAMIFCGPRGVGKTTCARIFANEINKHQNNDLAFNIFELDAASNNSVSDIRNLIEQVRIPPQTGKFKVFIIDEVHMLSQTAFNAFLKTLEEPPKHVVFILATTEKEKIIPTILSRCQIFDFKRIKPIEVKSFLISIAEKEKIKFEEGAIDLISQKSDGAMRDGLSIFDRMVTFTNSNLNSKDVSLNLNLLDKSTYVEICEKLFIGDFSKPIIMFNDLISNGFDGFQFIDGLCRHIRDLIMCHDISTADLLDLDSKTKEKIILQSKNKSKEILLFALDISNEYSLKYKTSINPNLQVELCLMQIASIDEEKKKKLHKTF